MPDVSFMGSLIRNDYHKRLISFTYKDEESLIANRALTVSLKFWALGFGLSALGSLKPFQLISNSSQKGCSQATVNDPVIITHRKIHHVADPD
jgi:hypothetical protein